MKQLKKMALKEAVVLTDNEKKMVRGGDKKEKSCDKICTGSCTVYRSDLNLFHSLKIVSKC